MRVSLPVFPHFKTQGEVATLQWVREETDIPVPRVIAFQDRNTDEIGFEWILMELMPGLPASKRWRKMSMSQKEAFTNRIAEFQAQLSGCRDTEATFRGIGTLTLSSEKEDAGMLRKHSPGQMISHEFFMGDRFRYDVPRGPFRSSHDWLSSELELIRLESDATLQNSDDEDEKEDAEIYLHVAGKLKSLLPTIFPAVQDQPDITSIWHDDLNLNNILVDEDGNVTAVVDWECVSALPAWFATKFPKFIRDGEREKEPIRDNYGEEQDFEKEQNTDGLDNEGKTELYWIHRMEYEATQLRKTYDRRLAQLWPDRPLETSRVKLDFYEAMLHCNAEFGVRYAREWVESMETGEPTRWADVIREPTVD